MMLKVNYLPDSLRLPESGLNGNGPIISKGALVNHSIIYRKQKVQSNQSNTVERDTYNGLYL